MSLVHRSLVGRRRESEPFGTMLEPLTEQVIEKFAAVLVGMEPIIKIWL